ncbi:MAG: DUF1801 domain-containing protein [Bacteroidetes bacterium]|nr:DUF1801 domain-containing protein [Bacteroidota bacterium]
MTVKEEIKQYLAGLPDTKVGDMQALHKLVLKVSPKCKLWFTDGKNSEGKIVTNPGIGYGLRTIHYADGSEKEFYQVGLSANKTGISVYILGLDDKTYLQKKFGKTLGKASVTGYCIRFKTLSDIDIKVLEAAIRVGLEG